MSRKQNVYSLFTNHASQQYEKLSRDERIAMIKLVGIAEDDDYVDDLNYNKKMVINAFYHNILTPSKKTAWRQRAQFLNSHKRSGMFRTLPRDLYDEDFNRRMLQQECHHFSSIMQRALTSRNMKDLATRSFNLLYSSVLETQALRQVHASNVLLALIFGQTFREKKQARRVN